MPITAKRISKVIQADVLASGVFYPGYKGTEYPLPRLNLLTESASDEGAYIPPQHISIYSKDSIRNLRDFCNLLLGETNGELEDKDKDKDKPNE